MLDLGVGQGGRSGKHVRHEALDVGEDAAFGTDRAGGATWGGFECGGIAAYVSSARHSGAGDSSNPVDPTV